MSNTDFLAFLVDETLKLQKNGEVELSSLELKLKDYGLNFFKGVFIPQLQVLRFNTSFGQLDVPINWSIFSHASQDTGHTILDHVNDTDHFFTVIKNSWNNAFEKILVTHDDGFCYLVGLKAGEDSHLHDLLNPQVWLKAA